MPATPSAVAGLYADFLDGWLVAPGESARVPGNSGFVVRERPLLMSDAEAARDLAGGALALARELATRRPAATPSR